MHVAAWYRGTPAQSSPNSGNNCRLARPLILPNFIALGQTVYEKSVIIFYTLHYSGAQGGPSRSKFINLGHNVQQGSLYQPAKFRPVLKTSVRDICCEISSIPLTA